MKKNPKIDNNQNSSFLDISACLLCGSDAKLSTIQKGYIEPDLFKIYHCDSCNTSFSLPRENGNRVYDLIYKNTESIRGYSRYAQYQKRISNLRKPLKFLANAEPSYWGTVEAVKSILNVDKNANILEFGSGLGYLTYSLKKAGYNIKGLDISNEAVNAAIKRYGDFYICDDLFHFTDKNMESYDIVIMTEVIEHLSDPKKIIKSIKQLLKPNGVLILTTPNKSFYPNEVVWHSDAPPVHCWWFSENSINYIAKYFDMKLIFIDFKKYYAKHPELYRMTNLNNEGSYVFDNNGNVIFDELKKKYKLKMPKWIKQIKVYILVRNWLLQIMHPDRYKSGGSQSSTICAILLKD